MGVKRDGSWITYVIEAADLPTEEIVNACELVSRCGQPSICLETASRAAVGAPLVDEEGIEIGALLAIAAAGKRIAPAVEAVISELAGLTAPFAHPAQARAEKAQERSLSSDPAFLVRVLGKIQPLVSEIAGFSDILQREVIGTSRKRAGIIHQNANRVIRALKSVLDIVELETDAAIEPRAQTIDITVVARDALARHRSEIRKKGLSLELQKTHEDVEAHVDEQLVGQILDILLDNAVRYSDSGGVSVTVEKTLTEARIAVCDTGRGISAAFMPNLFEPFAASELEAQGRDSGVGLGLARARRLAEKTGSRITVASTPGKETRFTLISPLAVAGGDSHGGSEVPVVDAHAPVRLDLSGKPLVLFLEDNGVARRVIEMMIGKAYEPVAVATADDALRLAREHEFDLLLLDIALNERRTGVEVLQSIRKMPRYKSVPAIACTAYALPGLRERYMQAGFDEFIAKPFRAEQLMELMKSVLESGRREAESEEIVEEIDIELPPLPGTLPQMIELISGGDDAVGTEEVTNILKADPVATSWVLGHVNSAFYSVRGQVSTVDRAVTLLGGEPICNLVVAGLLARTFDSGGSTEVRTVHEQIVKTSLATAGFARELAAAIEMENPELAFTAGIMHDMGRMCLLAHDPPAYAELWIDGDGVHAPELGQELLNFGIDHVSLGLKVSRKWSLPPEIHAVIASYEKPDRAEAQHRSLATIVAVARAAALELISGESPHLERAIRRLEGVYEVEPGSLSQLLREREADVRSLIDSVQLG